MEPCVIATCAYCKKPIVQGQSFAYLRKTTDNTNFFLHLRVVDEPDCAELYHRQNGTSITLFEHVDCD